MSRITLSLAVFYSKDLPVEGMAGIGGWVVVLLGTILLFGGALLTGAHACRFAAGVFRIWRLRPRDGMVYAMIIYLIVMSAGAAGVTALLFWIPVYLTIHEPPEFIHFNDSEFVLVYRWRWLDKHIPYGSVRSIKLEDPTTGPQPRYRSRPPQAKVIILTLNRTYAISPTWPDSLQRARSICAELERHHNEFAGQ